MDTTRNHTKGHANSTLSTALSPKRMFRIVMFELKKYMGSIILTNLRRLLDCCFKISDSTFPVLYQQPRLPSLHCQQGFLAIALFAVNWILRSHSFEAKYRAHSSKHQTKSLAYPMIRI
jgi:hypothetical protein